MQRKRIVRRRTEETRSGGPYTYFVRTVFARRFYKKGLYLERLMTLNRDLYVEGFGIAVSTAVCAQSETGQDAIENM